MKKIIKRENLIRDSLYNTSCEVIRDDFDVRYGRGQLCGIVSAIMSVDETRTFDQAVAIVAPMLPEDLDWDCVPDSWRDEFHKALGPQQQGRRLDCIGLRVDVPGVRNV